MPIQELKIASTVKRKPDGSVTKRRSWSLEAEDIIAMGAVLVALLVVAGMIMGRLPVNGYTYGLAGLSLAGGAVAKIVKSRGRRRPIDTK